jgi:hypothetical protein
MKNPQAGSTSSLQAQFAGPANVGAKEDGIKEAQTKVAPARVEAEDESSTENVSRGRGQDAQAGAKPLMRPSSAVVAFRLPSMRLEVPRDFSLPEPSS